MDDKQALIRQWTSAIDDNAEQQLHAQALLEEAVEDHAASIPQVLTMLQRVTHSTRKRRHWAYLLLVLAAIALYLVQWYQGYSIQKKFLSSRSFSGLLSSAQISVNTRTPAETLLLYGDPQRATEAEQRRALWESEPGNPVYFAEFVRHYAVENRALPADCLKQAADIDPTNGYYHMLDAAVRAEPLVTKTKTEHPRSPVTRSQVMKARADEKKRLEMQKVNQFTLKDPAQAKQVLDSWRISLEKPIYESHEIAIHQLRAEILNRRTTWLDQFPPLVYVTGRNTTVVRERYLSDLLVASLQAADFSTPEGQQLFRDASTYAERIARRKSPCLVDALVKLAIVWSIYQQITVIETDALDPALVARWKERHQALMDFRLELLAKESKGTVEEDLTMDHGSIMSALILISANSKTRRPPVVFMTDLAPLRYADHCFVGRMMASWLALILLCLIPYHLLVKRKAFMHRVSHEMWQTVPCRHLIALTLGTVLLPMLVYAGLLWFTPLTGKEWNIARGFVFPAVPAVTVFLLILLLPRLCVGLIIKPWLALRRPTRGLFQRLGWMACALLLVPMLGMTWLAADGQKAWILSLLGIGWLPAIAWMVVGGYRGMRGRDFFEQALSGLRRRIIGVCTACSLMALAVSALLLPKLESHWVQRDKLLAIDHTLPVTANEAQFVKSMENDLRDVLGLATE